MKPRYVVLLLLIGAVTPSVGAQEGASVTSAGEGIPLENDCVLPTEPELPDGSLASQAEMVEAQTLVKTYLAGGDEYIACVDALEAGSDDSEQKKAMRAAHNHMVALMQALAGRFNEAIRAIGAVSRPPYTQPESSARRCGPRTQPRAAQCPHTATRGPG